ncbi:hypothetical protein HAX54_039629, partial [Datura stramonium]|nr:hypothetical protein [Datura stramonium]
RAACQTHSGSEIADFKAKCNGIKRQQGMEIDVAGKGIKRLQKGTKGASSSASKAGPARRFGAQAVEPHGLNWFNLQKEAKYAPKNWIDKGRLVLEFLIIRDKLRELGVGYIFVELEECNLTMKTRIHHLEKAPK